MNDKLFEMEGKQPVFLVTEEDLNNFALRIIDGVREVVEDALVVNRQGKMRILLVRKKFLPV